MDNQGGRPNRGEGQQMGGMGQDMMNPQMMQQMMQGMGQDMMGSQMVQQIMQGMGQMMGGGRPNRGDQTPGWGGMDGMDMMGMMGMENDDYMEKPSKEDMMEMKKEMMMKHMLEMMDFNLEDMQMVMSMKAAEHAKKFFMCENHVMAKILMHEMPEESGKNGNKDKNSNKDKNNNKNNNNNNNNNENNDNADDTRVRRQAAEEGMEGADMDMDMNMEDMMDETTMAMMADSEDMQEAMATMQDMMNNDSLKQMDGMQDHLKEMAGMLKWETMDEFYAESGYEVEKMKAKMTEDPEMVAMKAEMDSMIAEDKKELHDRMAPYAMHMKFKMCVGMPR